MTINYMKLQNGSDIRGVALAGIEGEPVTLTDEASFRIAAAFSLWLSEKAGKSSKALRIAVGTDSRLSADAIKESVLKGIESTDANSADCGMASTPAMFMATLFPEADFDGAIMITASHLPWNRNGMKFFTKGSGTEKADITSILAKAEELTPASGSGARISFDLMSLYSNHLREIIRKAIDSENPQPLSGYKIAVDAGNGAGKFFVDDVLIPLGADTSASRYLDPDGSFPNHVPNPELESVMHEARAMTLDNQCDLGIVFDTDVDRAAFVDEKGTILSRNRLIGLLAEMMARQAPGCTIVTDSVTSDHLTRFIEKNGCVHHRFKRGYRNVINEGIRLNREGINCPLAIETSGHCAFAENYFLDDGAYLATVIVAEMVNSRKAGKSLSSLAADLKDPKEAVEYRFKITVPDFKSYGETVLSALRLYIATQPSWRMAKENYEGVRVSIPVYKGWFLLRLSLHDPTMPMNIESDHEGGVEKIYAEALGFLETCKHLELPE